MKEKRRVRLTHKKRHAAEDNTPFPGDVGNEGRQDPFGGGGQKKYDNYVETTNHPYPDLRTEWKNNPRDEVNIGIPKTAAEKRTASIKATKIAELLLGEDCSEDGLFSAGSELVLLGNESLDNLLNIYSQENVEAMDEEKEEVKEEEKKEAMDEEKEEEKKEAKEVKAEDEVEVVEDEAKEEKKEAKEKKAEDKKEEVKEEVKEEKKEAMDEEKEEVKEEKKEAKKAEDEDEEAEEDNDDEEEKEEEEKEEKEIEKEVEGKKAMDEEMEDEKACQASSELGIEMNKSSELDSSVLANDPEIQKLGNQLFSKDEDVEEEEVKEEKKEAKKKVGAKKLGGNLRASAGSKKVAKKSSDMSDIWSDAPDVSDLI